MELIKKTHIDFTSKRKIAMIASVVLIVLGLISLVAHGGPRYSIDFEGGTLVQVQFNETTEIGQIRSALTEIGQGEATIQSYGKENEFLIRGRLVATSEEMAASMREALGSIHGESAIDIRRFETVGPRIGKELRSDAIKAILIAMAFIVLYISIRFRFVFAMGALAALAHDVIITLGIFSILDIEISITVIAAFLTIVGYSLNDTIVVYDRIRENIKTLRREKFTDIINTSINETLNRTVITSLTTLTVVLVLFFGGGKVIHSFAFALIIGVVIGTYSSIFIASPILIAWESRLKTKKI